MKRTLSFLLSVIMTVTFLCSSVTVYAEETPTDNVPTIENDVSISGTNSFGNLLSEALTEESDRQEENNGYNVFSAEVTGNIVTVEYETLEDCTLLAAVYDEEGKTLLTSGKAEISKDETISEVAIETDTMPEYFYLRVFMIDSDDLAPMCTVYESPNYTKEMQEFFAKTVDDFDADKVLNLDNDKTNNFAVYNDGVKTITSSGTVNDFTTIDEENERYIIENADDSVKSLKKDDIFVHEYDDGSLLIVDVGEISVDGTTVTITGQDTSMEEVFDYVKIDSTKKPTPSPKSLPSPFEPSNKKGIGSEVTGGTTQTISLDSISGPIGAGLYGSVTINMKASIKYYFSFKYQFIELKIESETEISMGVEMKAEFPEIPIGELNIPTPIPALNIGVAVSINIEVDAKIGLYFTEKRTTGFAYDSDTGFRNLSGKPETNAQLKAEGSVFIGISLKPNVNILSNNVMSVEVGAKAGFKISGEMVIFETNKDDSTQHSCNNCIAGDVSYEVSLTCGLKIMKLKYGCDFPVFNIKLFDFYYSFDKKEFGFGTCPYISYKVPVYVKDKNGIPVTGANVEVGSILYDKTNSDGYICIYLSNGSHNIKAVKDGVTNSREITIHNEAKDDIIITLDIAQATTTMTNTTSNPAVTTTTVVTPTYEGDIIESGNCGAKGNNVKYELYDNGTLRIYGTGDMKNYLLLGTHLSSDKDDKINNIIIEYGITSIGDYAFEGCSKLEKITIPDSIITIGESAIAYCEKLKSITIPNSVTTIKFNAFSHCESLKSITISNNITNIDDFVFSDCSSLEKILIPNNVTSIEGYAFKNCKNLKSISIPENVISIGGNAFEGCSSLESIIIPNSIISIRENVFEGCSSLKSITIPESVVSIRERAFEDCASLKSITIPDSVTSIGEYAFYNCTSLESINIPKNFKSINHATFFGCASLKSITIPDSVTIIDSKVFYGCTSLESIIIPNSVTSIYSGAFYNCENLKDVYYTGTEEEWNKININYNLQNATIHYNSTGAETQSFSPEPVNINAAAKANPLENLSPETIYNVYVFRSKDAENLLSADNLLYVMQFRADSSGNIAAPDAPDGETVVARIKAETVYGDANCDGKVNIADATAIVQSIGNGDKYALTDQGRKNADCYHTGDGVTGLDAMVIQQIESGIYSVTDLPIKD